MPSPLLLLILRISMQKQSINKMQLRVHVLAFTRIFGYVGLKGSLSRSLQTILRINLDGTADSVTFMYKGKGLPVTSSSPSKYFFAPV